MPELPEVETVVRDLKRKVVGATIVAVWTDWPKAIKDPQAQSRTAVSRRAVNRFVKTIREKKILDVKRKGKNILIYLSGDMLLLIHQKMTGHLLLGRWDFQGGRAVGVSPQAIVEDSYNHHVHLIFFLHDGRQLGLSDVRKFAKVLLGTTSTIEALPELAKLGPDALDPELSLARFAARIAKQRRPIKQVLMDPAVVAGIGNIYADDILWRARIHPKRRAATLQDAEVERMFKAMREVLTRAVQLRGTSTSDFRDTDGLEGGYTEHRLVYQRHGQPCGRCGCLIERIVLGGRSAHFCPWCQKIR
jgi:formamidopyrimidine-DNA glycosylase